MFQEFIRACIVDPKLEAKVHKLADEALEATRRANAALKKVDNAQDLVVLAGIGLLVAGFMAGSKSQRKTTPPPISNFE